MILTAMEAAQKRSTPTTSPYGSAIPKRAYIYGRLDPTPTSVPPTVGMTWGVNGFLLPHFLDEAGEAVRRRMESRVLAELTTTFAIAYTQEIDLDSLLDPAVLARPRQRRRTKNF